MKTTIIFFTAYMMLLSATRIHAQTDTITILHMNDSHSGLAPYGPRTSDLKGTRGGIARAASVIGNTKMTEQNVLTLHAGDFSVGDIFYNAYFGVPELRILSALGLDAMTVGNHEFDLTPATLQQVLDTAFVGGGAFPLLSANCVLEDSSVRSLKKYIQSYTIKTYGATKIGIFGLTTPSTNLLSQPAPAFLDTNLIQISSAMVDTLKAKGCNVILLLSHLGYDLDSLVASYVPGVTMIIGGHDHYVFQTPRHVVNVSGDTIPIVQAGAHYSYIGKIHLVVHGSKASLLDYTMIPLDENIPEEPQTKAIIDTLIKGVEAMFGPVYSQKLTYADNDFDEVAENLTSEGNHDTPVGNLVTDAFRAMTGSDIAIEVGGSTADKLYQGPIVGADIFRMIGYGFNTDNGLGYRLATFTMSGAALMQGLEFGLSDIEHNDEFLVQTSGMKYSYDPKAPQYRRLRSVIIGSNKLDTGKLYLVAANEFAALFLSEIGIPYTDLKIYKDTSEFQVVSAFVSKRDTIKPLIEGRVSSLKLSVVRNTISQGNEAIRFFPNPAINYTTIQFTIANQSAVKIKVFSSLGIEVASFDGPLSAGIFTTNIPTQSLCAGTYFCAIEIGNQMRASSFVVVK
jgi:5'-nucleotidase/UDP-sugar diphosphatase